MSTPTDGSEWGWVPPIKLPHWMGWETPPKKLHEWGVVLPRKSHNFPENFKNSEKKMVKTRVPQCPQCTKLNQNGALDQGNNLGGSPGPQEVLKYEFLEVIFCTFLGHIPLKIMGSTPPHEEET